MRGGIGPSPTPKPKRRARPIPGSERPAASASLPRMTGQWILTALEPPNTQTHASPNCPIMAPKSLSNQGSIDVSGVSRAACACRPVTDESDESESTTRPSHHLGSVERGASAASRAAVVHTPPHGQPRTHGIRSNMQHQAYTVDPPTPPKRLQGRPAAEQGRMAARRRRGGGYRSTSGSSSSMLLRLLLLAAVGPLAAWGFGPFSSGGTNSLRGDSSSSGTGVAGGRRGGWVPPALRPVVRVRGCVFVCICTL